jgi:hypothetical protein
MKDTKDSKTAFTQEAIEKAKDLFKQHPKAESFWMSSDCQFFDNKKAAHAHGSRLENKTVSLIKKSDCEAEKEASKKDSTPTK